MQFTFKIIIIFLILFSRNSIISQIEITHNPYTKFDIFTTKNGLSNNRIIDVYQDKTGYLWIATENGLNKYDGYSFLSFSHDPNDSTSISGKIISSIAEDNHGNLWVGSDQGLDIKNENDDFLKVFPFDQNISAKESFVRAIFIDKNGFIWFDTAAGDLYKYDPLTKEHKSFKHKPAGQLYTYFYHTIYEDSAGLLWIGGRGIEVCSFNPVSEQFTYYPSNLVGPNNRRIIDVMTYFESSDGVFWVGKVDGLYTLNRETGEFELVLKNSTFDIIEDQRKQLWIINGNKINIFDTNSNSLTILEQSTENQFSIPSKYLLNLNTDRAGNIWIGTLEGLAKYSPSKNKFQNAYRIFENERSLSSNLITSVLETTSGDIWVGSENQGIDILDQNFVKKGRVDNSVESQYRIKSNAISTIFQDSKERIFVGLWAGLGFHMINPGKNLNKLYSMDPNSTNSDWYNGFMECNNGDFWLGTWCSYGIVKFDPLRKSLFDYLNSPEAFHKKHSSHFVTCLIEDNKGIIWIGTSNQGLVNFNNSSDKVINFKTNDTQSLNYMGHEIHCLFLDSKGQVWIGSEGLFLYDEASNSFIRYSEKDGLPDNSVVSVTEDHFGHLWIGTLNGLSKFDQSTKSFENYYKKDGLAGNECTKASTNLKNGKIIIGTKDGLTVFEPESILKSDFHSKPLLKSYSLFLEQQDISTLLNANKKFKHNQNYFSFNFSSSDLSDPENNQFAYKLENFDHDWNYVKGNNHYATYKYLKPDNYTFKLKTANADGIWSEEVSQVSFRILPPFWKSWWFILIEVLFLLGLVFLFVKSREKRIRNQHQMDLIEQKLLRSQMNPHFIFNALGAIQSYIFSKNPLEAGSYLAKFADLMRSILYNSRVETISLEKEIETLKNYLAIQQLRFENAFEYSFILDPSLNTAFIGIPPMLIQPFVENAIEHGFKNIDYLGQIKIQIEGSNEKLFFTVTDNGIGIDNAALNAKKKKGHKSVAIQITKDRLKSLNKVKNVNKVLNIKSSSDADPSISGTTVSFFIPKLYI